MLCMITMFSFCANVTIFDCHFLIMWLDIQWGIKWTNTELEIHPFLQLIIFRRDIVENSIPVFPACKVRDDVPTLIQRSIY